MAQLAAWYDLNIKPAISSLLSSLFFLGYFFYQVPGTHYAATRSAKKLIFWSLLLWGTCAMATGMTGTGIVPEHDFYLEKWG